MQALSVIGEAVTPVMMALAVVAGALCYYWDAPMFVHKGLEPEASVTRAVGLGLMIAGVVLYLAGVAGRMMG